jgi:mono/diheme cytochrome c family protein
MIRSRALQIALLCAVTAILQTACEKRPDGQMHFVGEPDPAKKWKPPEDVIDFTTLYSQNCIACHGAGKTAAAAIAMDNQTYLNLIPAAVLRNAITNGVKGTRMPGFGEAEGGGLTEKQIDILVNGILAWKKPLDTTTGALPAYSAPLGNPVNGQVLFSQSFEKDRPPAETYLNPAFLGLVSDQYLRTLVIVGIPELGYPDYRGFIPGRALTDQEVSDVTAWLVSNRKNEYGQPLAAPVQ